MSIEDTLLLCSKNYTEFKKIAEREKNIEVKLRYYKKALFWLENYVAILSIILSEEKISNEEDLEKIEKAKKALIKKLSNYLKELMNELES